MECGIDTLEPQEHRQIQHRTKDMVHGMIFRPHQHQGWAFTLGGTPSTYDQRSQVWVFGLCAHHMALGQLQRLGALTGIPNQPHTKTRALIAGLVALAKHTATPVRVIVQLAAVWEVWTQPRHRGPFQDLLEHLTEQDFTRATVLYVCRSTRTPEAPGNEPQSRTPTQHRWAPHRSGHQKGRGCVTAGLLAVCLIGRVSLDIGVAP